jgi:hypothetical protein
MSSNNSFTHWVNHATGWIAHLRRLKAQTSYLSMVFPGKNVKFATWGGDTEEEKAKVIGAYHMFPSRLKKVYDESGVKNIVMVHVQNYNDPEHFNRLDVLNEMIDEGIKNVLLAQDGDLY